MTGEELDPRIVAALKQVSPVDPDTRETHIAAALAAGASGSPTRTVAAAVRSRTMILVAAAAVLVAFVAGRVSNDPSPTPIVDASTTTIVKAGVDSCRDSLDSAAELLHTYEVADIEYAIVGVNGQIFIMETSSCDFITQFAIEGMQPPALE